MGVTLSVPRGVHPTGVCVATGVASLILHVARKVPRCVSNSVRRGITLVGRNVRVRSRVPHVRNTGVQPGNGSVGSVRTTDEDAQRDDDRQLPHKEIHPTNLLLANRAVNAVPTLICGILTRDVSWGNPMERPMCLICVEYQNGKMTIREARSALGEMREKIGDEHTDEIKSMLEKAESDDGDQGSD